MGSDLFVWSLVHGGLANSIAISHHKRNALLWRMVESGFHLVCFCGSGSEMAH